MTRLNLFILFLFLFPVLNNCTQIKESERLLPTTITGQVTKDGHAYTFINNYGIWASIIVYTIFWIALFASVFIPFTANTESYSPVLNNTNRINVEMTPAKVDPHNVLASPDPISEKPREISIRDDHDVRSLVYIQSLRISPIYAILHSRCYGECTKKICLLIVNLMTILMFLSILYNSNNFDVITKIKTKFPFMIGGREK